MTPMMDPDVAQAAVLIGALRDQVREMAAKVARAERDSTCGRTRRAQAMRRESAQLRRDIGIDYPILIGEKDGYAAAEAFGVALVLPFSVFSDSRGRIVTLKIGELHANEAAFILDRVRDIDTKRLDQIGRAHV